MYKVYGNWPNIAKTYFEKEVKKIEVSKINQIIFAGMGGSGVIGDVFSAILTKTICLMYILDYTTIYKAVLSKINPSPVLSIDFVKRKLK